MKYILNLNNRKKNDYYSKERAKEDLNNEHDKDWLKEVCERIKKNDHKNN